MDLEKVYQMFILGTGNLDEALQNGLGGVIFFSDDLRDEQKFIQVRDRILSKCRISPFISTDEEGGRVERTEHIRPKRLSAKPAFEKGEEFLKNQTQEIAQDLRDLGFNLNFAPVADVNTNPNNPIIGERAFSNNPDEVIKGVNIVSETYRSYGIIPCLKHYPGHGDANADSHKTLPVIDLDFETMCNFHIKPFRECIKRGVDMIMAAHLHCICFDKEPIPSSLSKNAISYLRRELGYEGVIISDDMVMKGIQYPAGEACIKGIDAGLNILLYRKADDTSLSAIEDVIRYAETHMDFRAKIEESYDKITRLKNKYKFKN